MQSAHVSSSGLNQTNFEGVVLLLLQRGIGFASGLKYLRRIAVESCNGIWAPWPCRDGSCVWRRSIYTLLVSEGPTVIRLYQPLYVPTWQVCAESSNARQVAMTWLPLAQAFLLIQYATHICSHNVIFSPRARPLTSRGEAISPL
jgi:hypothetical protein